MNCFFTYATTISGRWTNYRESLSFIRRTRGGNLHAHTVYPSYTFTQPRPATGQLTRYRLDMNTGTSKKEILPSAIPGEFPQWDWRKTGSETPFTYTAGIWENETPGFYNALQRVDYQTGETRVYDCGPGRYTSEPIFVPRSPDADEADGYILCVMYDAATELSELMILDAASMAEEIAVVPLKNNIPTVSTAAIPHCKAPVPAS